VQFQKGEGSFLRVEETSFDETTGGLVRGSHKDFEGAFDGQFVEAGEELTTTVVFDQPPLLESTVGWNVYFIVGAPTQWNRLRRSASGWWLDQTFVPCPPRRATVLEHDQEGPAPTAATADKASERPASSKGDAR
jgi:hypothetical protein